MFTELDINARGRERSTHDFFQNYDDPFLISLSNVDVTRLYRFLQTERSGVLAAALYYTLLAANEIREFRIRLMDGRLVEFDKIHATQTILNDDETFSFCYYEMQRRCVRIHHERDGRHSKNTRH